MSHLIFKATDDLIREINYIKTIENSEEKKVIDPYIDAIELDLKNLKGFSSDFSQEFRHESYDLTDSSKAYKMIAYVQSAQATAQLLAVMISSGSFLQLSTSKIATWVTGTLIPWLKNLGSSVWAAIHKLITPKEWKIKGGLGSSVLGLGNAELEITFG